MKTCKCENFIKCWFLFFISISISFILSIFFIKNNFVTISLLSLLLVLSLFGFLIFYFVFFKTFLKNLKQIDKDDLSANFLQNPSINDINTFFQELKNKLAQVKETREQYKKLKHQKQFLTEQQNKIKIRHTQTLQKEENLRLLFEQLLKNIKLGIFFIDTTGTILPNYTEYLNEMLGKASIAGKNFSTLFLSAYQNSKISLRIKNWLNTVLDAKENIWEENPPKTEIILFKKEVEGKIFAKYLKMNFAPVIQRKSIKKIIVTVEDITDKNKLTQDILKTQNQCKVNAQYVFEMTNQASKILEEFLQRIDGNIKFFQKELELIYTTTFNKQRFVTFTYHINNIKNYAQLLKLEPIIKEINRIQTLGRIANEHQSGFKIEQLLEFENCIKSLLMLLIQCKCIGEEVIKRKTNEIIKDTSTGIENVKLHKLEHQNKNFYRAILSSKSFPNELIKFGYNIQKLWGEIIPGDNKENFQVFNFFELLERVVENLQFNTPDKSIDIIIKQDEKLILLYCDILKMTDLLSLFMKVSLYKAKESSAINTQILFFKEQDSIKLQTKVTIRNTDPQDIDKLETLILKLRKFCKEYGVYFSSDRWGFNLELPFLINKYLNKNLKIGILGSWYQELEMAVNQIDSYFPFTIEIVPNISNYSELDLLMIDAEMISALTSHIEEKKNEFTPLIAVFRNYDEEIYQTIIQKGYTDTLTLPFEGNDLKVAIFNSLEDIVKAKQKK